MRRRWLFSLVLCCASALAWRLGQPALGQGTNLVPNPSFERIANDAPEGWKTRAFRGRADFASDGAGREGGHSVSVASTDGVDASWYVVVPVRPFSTYRLSAWIRTENVRPVDGQGALVNLHSRGEHTEPLTGTRDWTRVSLYVETGSDDALWINCLLGYHGRATGRAWFDDLTLEPVVERTLAPRVVIDAAQPPAEPISKYIYGQFIEHLGRCIYGGIWAEMLEDRKFFHPVGSGESPWQVSGGATVIMDDRSPFAGEHSPRVTAPGTGAPAGLVQEGLSVVAGQAYVGRIWLAGGRTATSVTVSLSWGEGADDRQSVTVMALGPTFASAPLRFSAGGTSSRGRLAITTSGRGSFGVGAVSLMPSSNLGGLRADTVALLKELNAPIYRWPGGNFVSGYDWRDGVGDRDRRPPRKNPAWRGIDTNDFGLHEFLAFCREIGTEPLIVVNTGFGDAHSAAEQIEYVNGATTTAMGAWRARNGQAAPFAVKWWAIGNEMYGSWQLGHMALDQYVLKHNDTVRQMRRVDPSIRVVGVGDAGPWSEGMLKSSAPYMDYISEHFYCQERPGLLGHASQIREAIRAKVAAHRRYRETLPSLEGRDIRISMDEWNYWYGPHLYGELGTRYFLKDALGIAAGLHEYYRNSDLVYMANYAQTVNVIGAIKTTPTAASFETTGLVLKLYRQRYGTLPLRTEGAPEPLDVAAALTPDRSTLTLAIVNPTAEAQSLGLRVQGLQLTGAGERFRIAGDDPMVYNEPGRPARVAIEETRAEPIGEAITAPPLSVTLYRLGVAVAGRRP